MGMFGQQNVQQGTASPNQNYYQPGNPGGDSNYWFRN